MKSKIILLLIACLSLAPVYAAKTLPEDKDIEQYAFTVGDKKYYRYFGSGNNAKGLFNEKGECVFRCTSCYIDGDYLIFANAFKRWGAATKDLDIVIKPEWDALKYHKEGKYHWFTGTNYANEVNTYKKSHPEEFPTHIIDANGKSYEFFQPTRYSGQSEHRITLRNGKLYVGSKPIAGIPAGALAYSAPAAGKTQSAPATKVTKEFPSLELIAGSLRFIDNSGRNTINADGNYAIEFEVKNTGRGVASNCTPSVKLVSGGSGITVAGADKVSIAPGATVKTRVNVKSSMATVDGNAEFAVKMDEPAGFGTGESRLSVTTHAFEAPQVVVNDYTVTSASGSTLQKKAPFDLQLLVQNIKHGNADNVTVTIGVPDNVFIIEGNRQTSLDRLNGGQTKELVYTLVANNNYSSDAIPIMVQLSEKYGKYSENRVIQLNINQALTASRIVVDEAAQTPRGEITLARLNSDVDLNIPETQRKSDNTFAVIIANESYTQVAPVPHAANDGHIFAEYCRRTLGIPERNIRHVTNATLNDMKRQISWLTEVGNAFGDKADIIFYYSGHGVPDESNGQAYILPVDGYHSDMSTNYAVDDLYTSLASTGARKVTVFMDACFSGSRRGDGMLMAARGVQIKSKQNAPKGNLIVFAAAQGDETAYPYQSQNHGLFTYFLLKKLQETSGSVHLGELGDYLIDNVKRTSLLENSKSQTPQVLTAPGIAASWSDLEL